MQHFEFFFDGGISNLESLMFIPKNLVDSFGLSQ